MGLNRYPRAIYVELTSRCNLRCSMCRPSGFSGSDISFDLFKEIATCLFDQASYVDLRGWGESTILPNLLEYVDISRSKCDIIKLISNGVVKNDLLWQELGRRGVIIGFSVDFNKEESYFRYKSGGSIKQLESNLKLLESGCCETGYDFGDCAYFIITVHAKNFWEIKNIIRFGHENNIRQFKLHMITISENNELNMKFIDKSAIEVLMGELSEMSNELGITIRLNTTLHPELSKKRVNKNVCLHPWDVIYINAKGGLGFCDHLNGMDEYIFGNWNNSFDKFWNGSTMELLRSQHLNKIRNNQEITICEECNYCYLNRYTDFEDLIDLKYKADIFKL